MPDLPAFPCDVFLSHSAKDKAVARPLAERLRKDGLKVWFNEWVLKPGDSIPAKIEERMEHFHFALQPSAFSLQPSLDAPSKAPSRNSSASTGYRRAASRILLRRWHLAGRGSAESIPTNGN